MGTVFKAIQHSLDRLVALKVFPSDWLREAGMLSRFKREAQVAAQLDHPNLVRAIAFEQDRTTGVWYLVMEYVDGSSLEDLLLQDRKFSEEETLWIARDVASALDYSHRRGIVHRDVKPGNILLDSMGRARLTDLGLAKFNKGRNGVTQAGETVGTPHYISPEQIRCEDVDIRSDIYSLGATLYHLLAHRPAFDGPTASAIMIQHLSQPLIPVNRVNHQVSEGTSRMVGTMMQKSRSMRPDQPKVVMVMIDRILEGVSTPIRRRRHHRSHHTHLPYLPGHPITSHDRLRAVRRFRPQAHNLALLLTLLCFLAFVMALFCWYFIPQDDSGNAPPRILQKSLPVKGIP
jgi:serine/threonine-protein kinase